jgi:hypothetical protein
MLTYSDCAIAPALRVVEFPGPLVLDGKVVANARVNTANYFCGVLSGRQVLEVAKCGNGKCPFKELGSSLFWRIPANGSIKTEPLRGDLGGCLCYYRLRLEMDTPEIGTKGRGSQGLLPSDQERITIGAQSTSATSAVVRIEG